MAIKIVMEIISEKGRKLWLLKMESGAMNYGLLHGDRGIGEIQGVAII
ncbi:hypothetical protein [Desulfosporosinus sp.]|nr:hypothetical protein [Desulfosporosinus sp.]MBC2728903.1 hypothetical protein [Desulfosporosinus sp.]